MKRKIAILLTTVMVITSLAACAPAPQQGGATPPGQGAAQQGSTPPQGGTAPTPDSPAGGELADTLNVALNAEPSNLLPFNNNEIFAATVQRAIFNTLIYRDETHEFVGEAARSWEHINDRTIRFHLHENMTFSDGTPVTADDVAFTLMQNNEASRSMIFGLLESAEAVSTYVVDVTTNDVNAAFLSNLAHARTSIISRAAFERMGPDEYGRNPIGSGPFKLENWQSGSQITLTRRDDFWGEMPTLQTINFRFISEEANRSIELEVGAVDVVLAPNLNDLDRMVGLGFVAHINDSNSMSQFKVSYENVPDPLLREALGWAVDRVALTEAVYGNDLASPANGLFPLLMPGFVENYPVHFDVEHARRLVEQSSYNGEELEAIVANISELTRIAEILQFYWREAGINVRINMGEQATVRERSSAGDFQILIDNSTWSTGDPSRPVTIFTSSGRNQFRLPDDVLAELDRLERLGATTLDMNERIEIYNEFQDIVMSLWINHPLSHRRMVYMSSANVENLFAFPGGVLDTAFLRVYR